MLTLGRHKRITVAPGFFLLLTILFYLDDGAGIFLWALLAALLHEMGHICASLCLGGRWESLSLSMLGAELRFQYSELQPYWKENIVALAGPVMNLLAGVILWYCDCLLAGMISFALGVFNLLPVQPLDGGKMAFNLAAEFFGLDTAEWISAVLTGVCVGGVAGIGVVAATQFANFTIVSVSVWLLFNAMKSGNKNFSKK